MQVNFAFSSPAGQNPLLVMLQAGWEAVNRVFWIHRIVGDILKTKHRRKETEKPEEFGWIALQSGTV